MWAEKVDEIFVPGIPNMIRKSFEMPRAGEEHPWRKKD